MGDINRADPAFFVLAKQNPIEIAAGSPRAAWRTPRSKHFQFQLQHQEGRELTNPQTNHPVVFSHRTSRRKKPVPEARS